MEKMETPREARKSQQLIKEDLKINKAKRGKEAVSSGNIMYRNSNINTETNNKYKF